MAKKAKKQKDKAKSKAQKEKDEIMESMKSLGYIG